MLNLLSIVPVLQNSFKGVEFSISNLRDIPPDARIADPNPVV